MTSDNEKTILIEKQADHRRAYHSPKLSSFGAVSQLTQTNADMMKADGGEKPNNMIS